MMYINEKLSKKKIECLSGVKEFGGGLSFLARHAHDGVPVSGQRLTLLHDYLPVFTLLLLSC